MLCSLLVLCAWSVDHEDANRCCFCTTGKGQRATLDDAGDLDEGNDDDYAAGLHVTDQQPPAQQQEQVRLVWHTAVVRH